MSSVMLHPKNHINWADRFVGSGVLIDSSAIARTRAARSSPLSDEKYSLDLKEALKAQKTDLRR